MKKFYSIAFATLCAAAMSAQQHNVDITFDEAFVGQTDAARWLEVMFVSNYTPATSKNVPGTFIVNSNDLSGKGKAQTSLEAGKIDGLVLTAELGEDGLAYVTCPSEAYVGGALKAVEGGDIRFRIAYAGSPTRPGDTHALYVYDMTGMYATASAPAGTKVNGYVVAAACATFDDTDNGKYFHTVFYDFNDVTAANTPTDITTGEAYGATNLFTFRRSDKGLEKCDAAGYPCKYFDVVFRGIKAGQKVGLCNYQTIYDGITPRPYTKPAGINEVAADDANAPVEYFNLQGMKVENPVPGIYIKRQGTTINKVVIR